MKNIFIVKTEYTNGTEEYNGVFSTMEKAENMLNFMKKQHMLGELEFKTGHISTLEVEDDLASFKVSDEQEFVIL